MAGVFSGSEIIEIGIQIEKNGLDFYTAAGKKAKSKKAKDLFQFLADQEEEHIAAFKNLLESASNYEPRQSYPEEYFAYMNALAGEHVFTKKNKGAEAGRKIKSELDAVKIGIGAEQDTIIFYEGVKKIVPDKDRGIVEELLRQEEMHLVKLTNLKKTLSGS